MPILELQDGRKIEIQGDASQEQIDSLLNDLAGNNKNSGTINENNNKTIDQQISERKSAIADLTKNPTTWQHPLGAVLRTLAGASELYQGVPASIALDLQAGKPQDIMRNLTKVATGQRPAEYGDIFKGAGVPAPLSEVGGLYTDFALSPGGAEGMIGATKLTGNVLRGTGEVLQKSGKYIGNILNKARASYITNEVAPKAHNLFKSNVENFTPEIQNYAKKDLEIPEDAIKVIKDTGVKNIDNIAEASGKSTDPIYLRIQEGVQNKEKQVEDAYNSVFNNFGSGGLIHVDKTKSAIKSMLREYGYIDSRGRDTAIALNDTIESSPLKRLLGFYKSLDPDREEGVTALNASQWNLFRNNLSKLSRQDKTLSSRITNILDALHVDAEKAGLKGISNARNLARENFKAQDEILNNSLIKERRLDNYFKLSNEEKRNLLSIEKFIGKPFVDDLKKITASKYLTNIRKGKTLDDFVSELNSAQDSKMTAHIMNKYSKILGRDNANKIFREIIANRRIRTVGKAVGWGTALTASEELIRRNIP